MSRSNSKLPFLPGYQIDLTERTNFAKSHLFDVKNGVPLTDVRRTSSPKTDGHKIIAQTAPFIDPRPKKGNAITSTSSLKKLPDWVKYDRKVLRYWAHFVEPIYDSPIEKTRVRKFRIYFHLNDKSIHIEEFKDTNSGFFQGRFLEKARIPKNLNAYIEPEDLLVGHDINIFSRKFHITDADKFTREFMKKESGIELAPKEAVPIDDWNERKLALDNTKDRKQESDIRTFVEASLGKPMKWHLKAVKKFLANDRKVLKFWCVWDDPSLYGEKRKFILHYFLADGTVEVSEVHTPNSGRDYFPQLLSRCKLPKCPPPIGAAIIGTDHNDKIEFYTHADFRVGCYVTVYSRHFLIIKADDFTKQFYKEVHGLKDEDFVPVEQNEKIYVPPKVDPPPYNGYGEEEDSLGSFYSLVPKPPRRNYTKLLKYDKTALRFLGKLVSQHPEDQERRFIIEFFLSNDTIRVYEQSMRNSGFVAGKFLDRMRCKNSKTGEWFKPGEFFVGASLVINGFLFDLLEADEATLNFMEGNPENFTKANVEDILKGLADSLWDKSFRKATTFREIDKDKDRYIDVGEFADLCEKLGWKLDEHQKLTIFRKFDDDGSGRITFPEFFKALEKYKFDPAARNSSIHGTSAIAKPGGSSERKQTLDKVTSPNE